MLEESLEFIARRIQIIRDSRGVSARDMSLSLGQNFGYINKIETQQAKPSITGLINICEYFGVTLAEFFKTDVEAPLKIKELLTEAGSLDEKSLNLLIEMAKKLGGGK